MKDLYTTVLETGKSNQISYNKKQLIVKPDILGPAWETYAQDHDLDEEFDYSTLVFDWTRNTVDVTLPNILTNLPASNIKFHLHYARKFTQVMEENQKLMMRDFSCHPTPGAEELVDTIIGMVIYIFNQMPKPSFNK